MKSQVTPIIPVAALVVATLAAGAAMWHSLFAGVAASTAARAAVAGPSPGADARASQPPPDAAGDDVARASPGRRHSRGEVVLERGRDVEGAPSAGR
jgi:hypothetical protein